MNQLLHCTHSDQKSCFLCAPPGDLAFFEGAHFIALAGLGPIVDGYSLIAAKAHTRSMADLSMQLAGERDALTEILRGRLSQMYGRCLVTEHGRMAVCAEASDHEAHCFHAHFLLFPGAHDISEIASTYFGKMQSFNNPAVALSYASNCAEYVLISPTAEHFNIFSGPLNIPRQLTRLLVANDAGLMHLADWRARPNRKRSEMIAKHLRSLLASEPRDVECSTNR